LAKRKTGNQSSLEIHKTYQKLVGKHPICDLHQGKVAAPRINMHRVRSVFCRFLEFVAAGRCPLAGAGPLGTDCGEKAWPCFDAACTRDARAPLVQPRDVWIVSGGRVAPVK